MVIDSDDSTAELLGHVMREAVPQQPLGAGQLDAPPPPVVRNPPRLTRRTFPEDLRNFAGRNAHFDVGCGLLAQCGWHLLDIYFPKVPPRWRAPAFEPARLVGDRIAAGFDDGRDAIREPMARHSPDTAVGVRVENSHRPDVVPFRVVLVD